MAYAAWSVSAFEQPTTSKWNILGTNDVFFNTQIGTNFSSGTTSTVWWEELGRTTLSGTSTSISVASLPARKFLRVEAIIIPSGAIVGFVRFNNDSATNYSYRYSFNHGATTTGTSQAQAIFNPNGGTARTARVTMDIMNVSSSEKMFTAICVDDGTAGAGTAPSSAFISNKWANTSSQINRIDLFTTTNNFASGSSVVVLGHD